MSPNQPRLTFGMFKLPHDSLTLQRSSGRFVCGVLSSFDDLKALNGENFGDDDVLSYTFSVLGIGVDKPLERFLGHLLRGEWSEVMWFMDTNCLYKMDMCVGWLFVARELFLTMSHKSWFDPNYSLSKWKIVTDKCINCALVDLCIWIFVAYNQIWINCQTTPSPIPNDLL